MPTIIKEIDADTYTVNDIFCYRDSDGKWHETEELTSEEARTFSKHLRTVGG